MAARYGAPLDVGVGLDFIRLDTGLSIRKAPPREGAPSLLAADGRLDGHLSNNILRVWT